MREIKEILPNDLPGDNSGNNIVIIGNARCGKSYLAEAMIKHRGGEFLLLSDDWFEYKIKLSSSQGTRKISGINSTTKPVITQLILKSNILIVDDVEFFLLHEDSQDYIDLFRLALENGNIITIILAQSPNPKVLTKLFPEGKITFDKMLVGKINYLEVANSLVENLPEINLSYAEFFDYSSEKRHFLYYQENKFQGIVSAN